MACYAILIAPAVPDFTLRSIATEALAQEAFLVMSGRKQAQKLRRRVAAWLDKLMVRPGRLGPAKGDLEAGR